MCSDPLTLGGGITMENGGLVTLGVGGEVAGIDQLVERRLVLGGSQDFGNSFSGGADVGGSSDVTAAILCFRRV